MSEYFGASVKNLLDVLKKGTNSGMRQIGKEGVETFQKHPNIEKRAFSGDLSESFKSSTKHEVAGIDSTFITSNSPYITIHDRGMPNAGIPFVYGKNGNPSTFKELVEKIIEWGYVRGLWDGSMDEGEIRGRSTSISKNIVNNEQLDYPFIDDCLRYIVNKAPRTHVGHLLKDIRAKKCKNSTTVEIKI